MATKVGVIGSGMVGQTLAAGFRKHGYDVRIGTRTPGKLEEWLAGAGKGVGTGDFADTAAGRDAKQRLATNAVPLQVTQ